MIKFKADRHIDDQVRIFYLKAMFKACLAGDELRRCIEIANSKKSLWKNSSKIVNFFMAKSTEVSAVKISNDSIFYRYDFLDDGEFVDGEVVVNGLNRDLLLLNLSSGEVYSFWHEGGLYLSRFRVSADVLNV